MCGMHSGGYELDIAPFRGFRCACVAAERARTRSGETGSELAAAQGERVRRVDARGILQTRCSPSRSLWGLQRACLACKEQYVELATAQGGCSGPARRAGRDAHALRCRSRSSRAAAVLSKVLSDFRGNEQEVELGAAHGLWFGANRCAGWVERALCHRSHHLRASGVTALLLSFFGHDPKNNMVMLQLRVCSRERFDARDG